MSEAGRLRAFAGRHRRGLWSLATIVVLYTLAGFLLAPWLIEKIATDTVRERYAASIAFDRISVNPYVLSLEIGGLAFDDPEGAPLLGIERIFINFQLSSLFRLAWTFDEFYVESPHLHLDRDDDGGLNASFLAAAGGAEPEPVDMEEGGSLPRLIVFDFAVREAVIDWLDRIPPEAVSTRVGPVSIAIVELNTLPQRPGEQAVVIATESQGTLTWSGSLQLNPLQSVGRAEIDGSHFSLISAYLRDQIGFDIVRGDADLELDYDIETLDDGTVAANVDNLHVLLTDIGIRTYTQEGAGGSRSDREVLAIPRLEAAGGSFGWPDRRVRLESFDIDNAVVNLYRDVRGSLNVLPEADAGDAAGQRTAEPEPATAAQSGTDAWDVSLGRFALNGAAIGLVDDSVRPAADLGIEDLDLVISEIDNADGSLFPVTLSTRTRAGGTVAASGEVGVLPSPSVGLDLEIADASLALMHPYIQPLADVSLDSGALELTATLRHDADNPFLFDGDAAIVDFLISETEEGSTLGSWARLALGGIAFDLGADRLEVDAVTFDEPYADILIDESGQINLGRIDKGEPSPGDEADEPVTESSDDDPGPTLAVSVGGIDVRSGSARFADLSLPLPFEAEIADLNGSVSTIATGSEEPAEVSLEGAVDEFGLARISGTITPFDPPKNTDLEVVFQNVDMPKMSAYTIPFAGREIANGRIDLDLGYRIEDGALKGSNNIVLREFVLGDKVPHPDAMSLPLGLAVALLKDGNGTIDIDLPVSGNVDDPEFSYGGVVVKALVNLVIRVAASPFALIGNLLGVEGSELEFVRFDYGRSDLTPPEKERISKLAEALSLRPELVLEVPPMHDPEHDASALKAMQLDAVIDARLAGDDGESEADDNGGGSAADRRLAVLEALASESYGENAAAELEGLRQEYTQAAAAENGDEPRFDAVAYAAELRRRLIAREPLDDGALAKLAEQRAEAIRLAIAALDPGLEPRVRLADPDEVTTDGDEGLPLKVSLGTAEESP